MNLFRAVHGKISRAAAMDRDTLLVRVRETLSHTFGYRANVRRLAYRLDRYSRSLVDAPYVERAEAGPVNLEVKLDRQRLGGPFEPFIITLVNRAAVTLVGGARRILEIGSGTGLFSWSAAADPERTIVASEFNQGAREWARLHRSRPNIVYGDRPLNSFGPREFDLVVAIEVIEHVDAFGPLLHELSRVAGSAIITTPNKYCDPFRSAARTPAFSEHVREWSAGEFLWVLRAFYADVDLFTLPRLADQVAALQANEAYVPIVAGCTDLSCDEPLIAKCSNPTLR
jgi:2-polyprenyl-3-methyl-5-hydroxy-6-metoxy-1,4-benzoquinol methylase